MKTDCGLCKRYGHGCQFHPDIEGDSEGEAIEGLCNAPRRQYGGLCTKTAGWGTDHPGVGNCRYHLGNSPSHRKAAQVIKAKAAVETYGLPREVEPHEALLEEIWRTAGHVDWLHTKVLEHEDPEGLVWGLAEETIGGQYAGVVSKAAPSVWLVLYQSERKHLVDVCRVALAAGIAEREVSLAEKHGQLIAQVIRGVLEDMGLPDDVKVAKSLRRHLTLVSGGKDK